MALAADIIEDKVKRAKGKPKESDAHLAQGLDAALRVRELERRRNAKGTAAVKVAEEFGMSKTAVQTALARWDEPTMLVHEQNHERARLSQGVCANAGKRAAATSKKVPLSGNASSLRGNPQTATSK